MISEERELLRVLVSLLCDLLRVEGAKTRTFEDLDLFTAELVFNARMRFSPNKEDPAWLSPTDS